MRQVILIVIGALIIASPTVASVPSPEQVTAARAKAVSHWGHNPKCGVPKISFAPLGPHVGGIAFPWECAFQISSVYDWAANPNELCRVVVHEYGHLVLGLQYFDGHPHSSDPHNVMYGDPYEPFTWQYGLWEQESAGCITSSVQPHKRKHGKARKKRSP